MNEALTKVGRMDIIQEAEKVLKKKSSEKSLENVILQKVSNFKLGLNKSETAVNKDKMKIYDNSRRQNRGVTRFKQVPNRTKQIYCKKYLKESQKSS